MAHGDKDLKLDIENEPITGEEEEEYQERNPILGLKNMAELLLAKARGSFTQGSSDDGVSLSSDASNSGSMTSMNVVGHDHNIKDDGKENKLLIRELAELARLKRARIKRMKALKNKKITKGTPPSSSNMLALECHPKLHQWLPKDLMCRLMDFVAGLAAEGKMSRFFG
ncbi:hypothetical protein Gotur_029950 [Gossypium turneri]